jgi:hypothetical protein
MAALIAITELLVGCVCLALAALLWRRAGPMRILAAVLAVAGSAAIGNAIVTLAQ